jgi:hypothetical protein
VAFAELAVPLTRLLGREIPIRIPDCEIEAHDSRVYG